MESKINTSIIGTTGSDPAYWPGRVFSSAPAQQVVLTLAESPRTIPQLAELMPHEADDLSAVLDQLIGLRAVHRHDDGRYGLSFSFLTRTDLEALDEIIPRLGQDVAECVLRRADALASALADLPGATDPIRRAELAFLSVGCLGLDWAGIAQLRTAGYLSPSTIYPDGGEFVLIGEERREAKIIKDYCGSHTAGGNRYAFTNFGDHSGPRHALPDLLFRASWAVGSLDWPERLRAVMPGLVEESWAELYDHLGAVLAGTRQSRAASDPFLQHTGYMEDGRCSVPLLTEAMRDPLLRVAGLSAEAVLEWAEDAVPRMEETFATTTPMRHGVERGHFLNHIWHFIFAYANRVLAESGFMLDPPPGPAGQGRYLAWVAEQALYKQLWSAL